MPRTKYKLKKGVTVKVRDNKRKRVVKTKSEDEGFKSKSVTDKKTGVRTKTTKTKKGNYKLNKELNGPVTKTTKRKTVQTKTSAKGMASKTAEGLMPMLRKLVPDSPMAKQAMKAIKMPAPMAKRVKMAKTAKKK